jgi:hypothetical protein
VCGWDAQVMLKLSGGQLTEALELLCECVPSSSTGGKRPQVPTADLPRRHKGIRWAFGTVSSIYVSKLSIGLCQKMLLRSRMHGWFGIVLCWYSNYFMYYIMLIHANIIHAY